MPGGMRIRPPSQPYQAVRYPITARPMGNSARLLALPRLKKMRPYNISPRLLEPSGSIRRVGARRLRRLRLELHRCLTKLCLTLSRSSTPEHNHAFLDI